MTACEGRQTSWGGDRTFLHLGEDEIAAGEVFATGKTLAVVARREMRYKILPPAPVIAKTNRSETEFLDLAVSNLDIYSR